MRGFWQSPPRLAQVSPAPSSPATQVPASAPDSSLVIDRAIRSCGRCGRELSVAERMFYFIEATEIEPLCRSCIGQEATPLQVPRGAPALLLPSPVTRPLAEPNPAPPPDVFEGVLLDAIRFFLSEELRRSGLSLARMPPDEARVRAARDLHNETEWLLQIDRIREAVESLRDLRTIVHSLESSGAGGDGTALGASEDPTIEELYDRVLRRASVLSARLRADVDANLDSLGLLDRTEPATGPLAGGEIPPDSETTEQLPEVPARVTGQVSRT